MFFWTSTVAPGVRVAFTDRTAGNLATRVGDHPEAVALHRRTLETALGVAPGSLRFMKQIHSTTVADAGDGTPEADALVSSDGSLPLAVMVADCVPVILVGQKGNGEPVTAAVHAGRLGVQGNIVARTVTRMREAGAVSLSAWVGPSICGRCYEVPADMREQVVREVPAAYGTTSWGAPSLDLPAGVRSQLEDAGVEVGSIAEGNDLCSLENERLFSHRAVPQGRPEGRMAGLVWFSG
ncbi:polyphenol oxidase family protein [Arthrobacter sp. JZ12]|uniref:polyphenol oxidase family protein n=1 Tax=Arthrobacter sp. JZ12 TaxID=2654190 RepID=UPI002B498D7B|nr:polyphenol oxidase family protein [Arthrobacter sp. JZ12]